MSLCLLRFDTAELAIVLILSQCSRGHLLERVVVGGFLMASSCLHLYFPTTSGFELSLNSAFHICRTSGSRASHLACGINATPWRCARCSIIKGNHLSWEGREIAVVLVAFLLSHSFLLLCPLGLILRNAELKHSCTPDNLKPAGH